MKEYRTKDLNEAGALLASSIKLIRLDQAQGFCYFVFENHKALEISNKFWTGELIVSAKLFSDALRTLKDRLFSQK
ncbi:MAG: DUF5659 domain-containing protein [Patescibacteria group bacterium]